jgi:hypothetical protein
MSPSSACTEDRRADYPVTIMCDVLGVSPAGYYAWRSRPESPRATANRGLLIDIKPAESLYAEVLRQPGVFESLQRECKVTLSGQLRC